MAALNKRKNTTPRRATSVGEAPKETQKPVNKKKNTRNKKLHGLAAQESAHNRIRNQLFWPVVIYILAGAAFLYWRGVSSPQEIPPEVENEILGTYAKDAKKVELPKTLKKEAKNSPKINQEKAKDDQVTGKIPTQSHTAEGFPDFQPNIQNSFTLKKVSTKSGSQKWKEVKYTKNNTTSKVRIFTMDNFLSPRECDGLMKAHENHVKQHEKHHPIICFSGESTMKLYLHQSGVSWAGHVTMDDFTAGTFCLNESMSSQLDGKLLWSKSTSFYPGESPFSTQYDEKVEKASGLSPRNGGKFQVTSYPTNVGYKLHTDCTVGSDDPRDRFATILVYLNDVVEGGETEFPDLDVKIKPRKGMALLWNNMDNEGHCDVTSHHQAAIVTKGKKYILQRWYYYQNFPALGQRTSPPPVPPRSHDLVPRVSCDRFDSGSCRWYDEWNYDHLVEQRSPQNT